MSDLRKELLGGGSSGVPAFTMALPPGWIAEEPTRERANASIRAAEARLRSVGNEALVPSVRTAVDAAYRDLRRQGAFLTFRLGEDAPEWATAPISMIATTMDADAPADSLDDFVRVMVQTRGARPLDAEAQIMTWLEGRVTRVDGQEVGTTLAIYLIPVPDTARRRAVQLTATLSHPVEVLPNDPAIGRFLRLLDAHVATFQWQRS